MPQVEVAREPMSGRSGSVNEDETIRLLFEARSERLGGLSHERRSDGQTFTIFTGRDTSANFQDDERENHMRRAYPKKTVLASGRGRKRLAFA